VIAVVRLLSAVGWRGLAGAVVGAAMTVVPAYQAGKWFERAAAQERIARILAERAVERLELRNERIGRALEARRGVARAGGDADGAGGLQDDGYRRD
jgi:hypothetical protein